MFAIVRDNEVKKIIRAHTPFEFESKQYSAKWTVRWSMEERAAFGIQDVFQGTKEDDKFYWVTPNQVELVDGVATQTFTCTPRIVEDREEVNENDEPLYVKVFDPNFDNGEDREPGAMVNSTQRLVTPGLKTTFTRQAKSICNSLLQESDWMIVRKHERDIDVPEEVAEYRAAVIAECDRIEEDLSLCTTLEDVIDVVNDFSWPRHYNDPVIPV